MATARTYLFMRALGLCLAISVWTVSALAGSSAAIGGPVAGFVFDAASGAVRPMLGIPGAAHLGDSVVSKLETAFIAPDGSAVLAVAAGRLILFSNLRGVSPAAAPVGGILGGVDAVAWSPDATAAAISSARHSRVQLLTGIPQTPSVSAPVDLWTLPGPLTVLACDGRNILIGVPGGIYIAGPGGVPKRIAQAASPVAIALAGADLYFADNETQQVWHVANYAGKVSSELFAYGNAVDSPAGLQLSSSGQQLYVANAGNRTVAIYDVGSQSLLDTLVLPVTPTRLDRFGASSVFLLNSTGSVIAKLAVTVGG